MVRASCYRLCWTVKKQSTENGWTLPDQGHSAERLNNVSVLGSRMVDCDRTRVISIRNSTRTGRDCTSCPRSASFCHARISFLRLSISERISRESSWCIAEEGTRFLEMVSLTCRSMTGVTVAEKARATWVVISGRMSTRSISFGKFCGHEC